MTVQKVRETMEAEPDDKTVWLDENGELVKFRFTTGTDPETGLPCVVIVKEAQ